jgi:hypothetical protein
MIVLEQTRPATRRMAPAERDIAALRGEMVGEVIAPGDEGYDAARLARNARIDRYPALIARPTDTADVIAAVNFARARGLSAAVRGGDLELADAPNSDGGLVIDLAAMNRIRIDPLARVAQVDAGATWAEFDRAAQAFGLATPGGEFASSGVADSTQRGEAGLLSRKLGLARDNLASVDVVAADGRVITASETLNADLYWGLRRGGDGLGVVTSLTFRLHPVGPLLYASRRWYSIARAGELLRAWRAFLAEAPDEVASMALLWSVPPTTDFPAELHGTPAIVLSGCYAGRMADGERALRPLRELGHPFADQSGPTTYLALQRGLDASFPEGWRFDRQSVALHELSNAALDAIVARAATRSSPTSRVVIRHLGGAIGHVRDSATASAQRDARFGVTFDAVWAARQHDAANIAWARDAQAALHAFTAVR